MGLKNYGHNRSGMFSKPYDDSPYAAGFDHAALDSEVFNSDQRKINGCNDALKAIYFAQKQNNPAVILNKVARVLKLCDLTIQELQNGETHLEQIKDRISSQSLYDPLKKTLEIFKGYLLKTELLAGNSDQLCQKMQNLPQEERDYLIQRIDVLIGLLRIN